MSMGDVLEPLRRDSTPERIAEQLRSGIVTGRLAPGQALREVEIARQLGVSRGPVREAFQRLIQEGLLEAHPARGVFVPQLAAGDIADLYLARGAVEIAAAQLLAGSGTPEAFADLSAALTDLRAAPADDWNELARLDLRLHEVLVRSTGSKRLIRMFGTLAAETRLCMVALESFYPQRADLVTEHAEIVEAIQRGDAATATRLLERHMSDSVQQLAGSVPASSPAPATRYTWHSRPPSTSSVWPVMYEASAEARNATAAPISSGGQALPTHWHGPVAAADAARTAPMEHWCRHSDSDAPLVSLAALRKGLGCAGQAGSSRWRPETTWVDSSRYP